MHQSRDCILYDFQEHFLEVLCVFDVNCRLCVQFEITCSAGGIGGISNGDIPNFPSDDSIKLCNEIKWELRWISLSLLET
jgi:hypothetical protein